MVGQSTGRRRGRPPGSKAKLRRHRVVTFLTEAEYAEMIHRAEVEDKSISALTHELLVQALNRSNNTSSIRKELT